MTVTQRATMYSFLVFPGAGYFILDLKARAYLCLVSTIAAIAVLFYEAFYKAQIIAQKIVLGQMPFDIILIRKDILELPGVLNPLVISTLSVIVGIVWLGAVIDCYFFSGPKRTTQLEKAAS